MDVRNNDHFALEGPECSADALFIKFGLAIAGSFDDAGFEIRKVVLAKHPPRSDPMGLQERYQFSVRIHLPSSRVEILWYIELVGDRLRWSDGNVVAKIQELCGDICENVPEVIDALECHRPPNPHGIAQAVLYQPPNPYSGESILGVLWECERP